MICSIKLNNSEVILAEFVWEDDEFVHVENPVKLSPTVYSDGKSGMSSIINIPSLYFQFGEPNITLHQADIMFIQECNEFYRDYYELIVSELLIIEKEKQEYTMKLIAAKQDTSDKEPDLILPTPKTHLH